MKTEDYLTSIEIDKIKAFNEDKVLKSAIRKVMLAPLYQHGRIEQGEHDPTVNFALTPAFNMLLQRREMWDFEKLGMFNMAAAQAIQFLEQGFGELDKFKNEVKPQTEEEPEHI
jgi:hypothetical protein